MISSQSFGQWSGPVNLTPNAVNALLNESMGPCIGVAGDTVHIVYVDRFNSKHGAIYYLSSSDSGLTWKQPIAITNINGNAWSPAIAVNHSNIHVVWREIDTINNHRSSHYIHSVDGGMTWGTGMIIDTVVADWPAVAVSEYTVYVVNDIVTSQSPYNTEIFFLKSTDNGNSWNPHQQITFAAGRSEDEAITAEGPNVFMSWNDNRTGQMQIFYKHSGDYGTTWGQDTAVMPPFDYGTWVNANNTHVDVIAAGAASGHYQIQLVQSTDLGLTWSPNIDLTNDTAHTYYYPYMVRDGNDLHVTYVKSGVGGQYLHSTDSGATWDSPYSFCFSGITDFIAYTGCVLHVILPDSGHINYFRNPTGNSGDHCSQPSGIKGNNEKNDISVFPNPVSDKLTIQGIKNHDVQTIQVYNSTGQLVFSDPNFSSGIIDTKAFSDGIYLLKYSFGNEVIIKKFLVRHAF